MMAALLLVKDVPVLRSNCKDFAGSINARRMFKVDRKTPAKVMCVLTDSHLLIAKNVH